MAIILMETAPHEVSPGSGGADQLWLSAEETETVSGWTLKPEGLCRGDICLPIPDGDAEDFVADGHINLAAFWRRMDKPVAHSRDGGVWAFGEGADDRAQRLQSLEAPDFSLPDLNGDIHRLSDYRGKNVFLVSFASW